MPVHVMEYHIWWDSPFYGKPEQRHWGKWNDANPAALESARPGAPAWRRNTSGGLPLIGCYSSANPDVIRWQLRCAKAAGITALQVQLFPNETNGLSFDREEIFADVVRIAGEEAMPVYIHDEVQFRQPPATHPEVMISRLTTALSRYGSLPGYYHIDGRPVISFQYWHQFAAPNEIEEIASTLNRSFRGGVYFILNGNWHSVFADTVALRGLVVTSNSMIFDTKASATPDWAALDKKLWKMKLSRLARFTRFWPGDMSFGLWAYPSFDDTKPDVPADKRMHLTRGQNLSTLRETIRRYAAERPDFVLVSSWNDWQENTALEPALDVDGFNGDPYQALRAVAELQGKKFTPPPLPPREDIDPMVVEKTLSIK